MEDSLILQILDIYAKLIIIVSPFGAVFFIVMGILMLRSTLIIEGIAVGSEDYSDSTLASLIAGANFLAILIAALIYRSYRAKSAAKKAASAQGSQESGYNYFTSNNNEGVVISSSA
ncbi:uncharacterized protein cubi_00785 [Cryptosporidium ubiquitum]|uniref:Uncharacterized protein n=1 Tax=Cryptosporidium ubiquitum TaxID=857276 RepID=A0A1J4MBN8_9CRYT|nr:uncharacterized protein cubi_00785 [Cryptosporidium ubiquitum]OII71407.1 hypothetical protein cubi_00785 [Cryptosporidium ubiquitum]